MWGSVIEGFDMDIPVMIWILCLVLPLITGAIISLIIRISYKRGLDDYRMERKDVSEIIKNKRRFVIMFAISALVPAFYGMILIGILMSSGEVVEHYQERALDMVGWIVGIPVVISLVSQGILISYFMKDYLKEEEPDLRKFYKERNYFNARYGSKRSPYSLSVIIYMIPQTIATFGLLIAIFLVIFSSTLDGLPAEDDLNQTADPAGYGDGGFLIDEENIDAVVTGSWIFVGLSTLSILSAFLPMLIKGSIMEKRVFKWRIILGVAGTLPSIIGLLIWILMMA